MDSSNGSLIRFQGSSPMLTGNIFKIPRKCQVVFQMFKSIHSLNPENSVSSAWLIQMVTVRHSRNVKVGGSHRNGLEKLARPGRRETEQGREAFFKLGIVGGTTSFYPSPAMILLGLGRTEEEKESQTDSLLCSEPYMGLSLTT